MQELYEMMISFCFHSEVATFVSKLLFHHRRMELSQIPFVHDYWLNQNVLWYTEDTKVINSESAGAEDVYMRPGDLKKCDKNGVIDFNMMAQKNLIHQNM